MPKVKIFYVEDEPFLAKIVKETLESKGFDVTHVSDGQKAIKIYDGSDYDICILDVMLPGKDGFSIGEEIRYKDQNMPIIFLTAKDQTKDLVKGFSVGGNDYIKKPFSMEELIVRIENLLKLKSNSVNDSDRQEIFNFGGFQFNTLTMQLIGPKETIQLSHRESEILLLLCQNINSQLERKKILLSIWGDDSFFNSRNLDVYMRKIRKYLSVDNSVQIITLKGIGYRLVKE